MGGGFSKADFVNAFKDNKVITLSRMNCYTDDSLEAIFYINSDHRKFYFEKNNNVYKLKNIHRLGDTNKEDITFNINDASETFFYPSKTLINFCSQNSSQNNGLLQKDLMVANIQEFLTTTATNGGMNKKKKQNKDENPNKLRHNAYEKRTLTELRALAKTRKIPNYSKLTKTEIIANLRRKN